MTSTLTLYQHVCDNVLEVMEKIGFTAAALHYNYPPRTLASLLGDREMSPRALTAALDRFCQQHTEALGTLTWRYRPQEDVYTLTVPAEGVSYLHAHEQCPPFTRELIALSLTPLIGRAEVHALFARYAGADGYISRPAPEGDFDEVLGFPPSATTTVSERCYLYCMEYGEERCEYHRLLPEDYGELYGERH